MKVLKVKVTKPVLETPRKLVVELTEGEADFILGIVARTDPYVYGEPAGRSPVKYKKRILKGLKKALDYGPEDSDAFTHATGTIHFFSYKENVAKNVDL